MNSRANHPCLHQWTVPLLVEILVCHRIGAKSWSELTYVDIRSRTWMTKWRLQYDSHFVLISICQRHRQMRTKSPLFKFYSGAILDFLVRIKIGIFHCTCDAQSLATDMRRLFYSTWPPSFSSYIKKEVTERPNAGNEISASGAVIMPRNTVTTGTIDRS